MVFSLQSDNLNKISLIRRLIEIFENHLQTSTKAIIQGFGWYICSRVFGIWDLGFGIWDLGFGIWDLGLSPNKRSKYAKPSKHTKRTKHTKRPELTKPIYTF
jgi:hypothetical protein